MLQVEASIDSVVEHGHPLPAATESTGTYQFQNIFSLEQCFGSVLWENSRIRVEDPEAGGK